LAEKLLKAVKFDWFDQLDNLAEIALGSLNRISMVAEGGGYASAISAVVSFKSLLGVNVGCFHPREYSTYAAPYVNEDELVIFLTRGSPLPPRILHSIRTCSIMNLKTALVVAGELLEEDEDVLGYIEALVELNAPRDNLAAVHFIASTSVLISLAAEIAMRTMQSPRAQEILNELERLSREVEVDEDMESAAAKIISEAASRSRVYVYAGPTLYGLALKICRDMNLNSERTFIPCRIEEHPYITRGLRKGDYALILKTELEEKSARELLNFLKMRGIDSSALEFKGEPLLAPIGLGAVILQKLTHLIQPASAEDVW